MESSQPEQNGQQPGPHKPGPATLAYMHGPPRIMPNYGNKKKSLLPKTKVSRVLLYDNMTQQQMLDVKLSHIKLEKNRASRLLDLHKRSFMVRQKKRQHQLQQAGVVLPEIPPAEKKTELIPRNRTHSSFHGNQTALSFDFETLKLPDIEAATHTNPHIVFRIKNAEGTTEIFHTIDNAGIFSDIVPLHRFYNKTTDDPRFIGLEGSLVKADTHDGFNELSPSYKKDYPKLPEHLVELLSEERELQALL